jgi:hypothetical protein
MYPDTYPNSNSSIGVKKNNRLRITSARDVCDNRMNAVYGSWVTAIQRKAKSDAPIKEASRVTFPRARDRSVSRGLGCGSSYRTAIGPPLAAMWRRGVDSTVQGSVRARREKRPGHEDGRLLRQPSPLPWPGGRLSAIQGRGGSLQLFQPTGASTGVAYCADSASWRASISRSTRFGTLVPLIQAFAI